RPPEYGITAKILHWLIAHPRRPVRARLADAAGAAWHGAGGEHALAHLDRHRRPDDHRRAASLAAFASRAAGGRAAALASCRLIRGPRVALPPRAGQHADRMVL